jgi:hypothetical protein
MNSDKAAIRMDPSPLGFGIALWAPVAAVVFLVFIEKHALGSFY